MLATFFKTRRDFFKKKLSIFRLQIAVFDKQFDNESCQPISGEERTITTVRKE